MSLPVEPTVSKKKVVVKKKKIKPPVIEEPPIEQQPPIPTPAPSLDIEIKLQEGIEYLSTIPNKSIDLILTDPPYIISRDSGMNSHYNTVKENERMNVEQVKTQEEWIAYKTENGLTDDTKRDNYIKYGTIYGKKYCVKTDYGDWDSDFTMDVLDTFIGEYYKKLRNGGTMIMFFDIWKIS